MSFALDDDPMLMILSLMLGWLIIPKGCMVVYGGVDGWVGRGQCTYRRAVQNKITLIMKWWSLKRTHHAKRREEELDGRPRLGNLL